MRLNTDYREQTTGTLKGTKQYFLVCRVEFSEEERSVVQERGMYDASVEVPSNTPPPTRSGDIYAMLMRIGGAILMPIGLVVSCATELAHQSGSGPAFMLFLLGVGLFVAGKLKDREANQREANPTQTISIRRLLTNPEFVVHAPDLQVAKVYEDLVRQELGGLAEHIRASTAVPEKTTYEL